MGELSGAARVLPKRAKAVESVKAENKRVSYSIQGEKGLRLVVHPSGRKVWFAVYQIGRGTSRVRRWHELGEHGYADFDKDQGRTDLELVCRPARIAIAAAEKRDDQTAAKTMDELFQTWIDEHAKKLLATWEKDQDRYRRHLKGALGDKDFSRIERKDVREVRDEVLEGSGPIESNRVVSLFNRVLNWAVDNDRAKFNPAARLKKVGEEKRRERVLSLVEVSRVWSELDKPLAVDHSKGGINDADLPGHIAVRHAIKLLMILGQRRAEVIGIAKSELDLTEGDAWWAIPAERTNNRLLHRVPLTGLALEVFREALIASGNSQFVFPSHRTDGPIRPDAVTKQLQRICKRMKPAIEGVGPHDLRRTAGVAMRKLGVSVEDRGFVFNHISGAKAKVTSWNYDPGEHDDEKVAALEKWERELRRIVSTGGSARVVQLRA